MFLLDQLAEQKITQHLQREDPADNPYCGQPLQLDCDAHVPSEVRALYRVLKHNGFVPAEVALHNEIQQLTQLLGCVTESEQHGAAAKRLQLLRWQLESRGRSLAVQPMAEYQGQILQRMEAQ